MKTIAVDVLDPRVEEQVQRENTMYLLVVSSLVAFAITGSTVVMSILAALGMMYLVPAAHMRKLFGYLILSDIAFSWWLVGVASATLGGLHIAVAAGVVYSLITREFRAIWGYERLAINGKIAFGEQIAEVLSQAGRWTRSIYNGLRHNEQIDPPPPLTYTWETGDEGGGFAATRTYRSGAWLLSAIPRALSNAVGAIRGSSRTNLVA